MKKNVSLFFVIFIFAFSVNAQENHLKIEAGFMLNAQGEVSFKEINHGIGYEIPLFTMVAFEKRGWSIVPVYGVSIYGNPTEETTVTNFFGGFLEYEFSGKFGLYFLGLKDSRESVYSICLGAEVPIARFANAFLEIGGEHREKEWEPGIVFGISIPLMFTLTREREEE